MTLYYPNLNPEKALLWRIVHRENLPWILDNGLHCGNCPLRSDHWISIGNAELIDKRANHGVPLAPYGTLNDYIPFYFTPFSIMLSNIHTGWAGIKKRENDEIIFLVSSLHLISSTGLPFLFTDGHAYSKYTNFYSKISDLNKIDWTILQHRDFKRDQNDLRKLDRYQAEALIYQHCPVANLLGVICYNQQVKEETDRHLAVRGLTLPVHVRRNWYFQ